MNTLEAIKTRKSNRAYNGHAVEQEKLQVQTLLAEVHTGTAALEESIENISNYMQAASGEMVNVSDAMGGYSSAMQGMVEGINELSDTMAEMDEAFVQMSEEAQEGKNYAQNSNNTAVKHSRYLSPSENALSDTAHEINTAINTKSITASAVPKRKFRFNLIHLIKYDTKVTIITVETVDTGTNETAEIPKSKPNSGI
jgi:uncharacterized coiled-coil DUF342 family protein